MFPIYSSISSYPKLSFEHFITHENRSLATPEAIRFLERLLKYDHQERCTAKEAMEDPYFGG
jgi:casein kinase II subunit alpha